MPHPFQYLNDFYDKIYVLSLPRLAYRRTEISKNLEGLNFEFFEGVDKELVSMATLKDQGYYNTERYQQFYKRPQEISLGMLCCAIGHVHIYEDIIRHGYQRTLILEDDAVALLGNMPLFPEVINELPDDWELLYLGYEKNEMFGRKEKIKRFFYRVFTRHRQLKLNRNIYGRYYPIPISKHVALAGFHDCSHAYAITLGAAKKLLSHQQPVGFHPDNLLSFLSSTGQLNAFISRPKFFNQLTAFVNILESQTGN